MIATILLMTPASYHRIVEGGEDSESLHRFASRCVLAALVPLGLGVAGDLYVVVAKVTTSQAFAVGRAVTALLFLSGLRFGLTGFLRARRAGRRVRPHVAARSDRIAG